MNVIVILIDSCNRHYLSAYGCDTVATPNIQRLADRGVTFTNHMIGSAPCMPARRELMTGRREFLWRGWGHMEAFDKPLALECRRADAVTEMVTDHYHYWESPARGYIEHFNGCEMIRGPEGDYWKTQPEPEDPDWVKAIERYRPRYAHRYYQNVAHFKSEQDFFSPKVFRKAAEWLDANHSHDKFMLWIESFDPHEPFHVPEPYRSMYTDDLNPDYTCWPPYQSEAQRLDFLRSTSQAELDYIRAQYKGKLTMVDRALSQVWSAMDRHSLWDNTMVILTSDHGHELAEAIKDLSEVTDDARDHTLRIPFGKQHPHYLSHARIPLIVWHPRLMSGGKKIDEFTTAVDIYPTVLEELGGSDTSCPHGRSILPLLRGERWEPQMHYWGDFGTGICCTDGEYVLHQGADGSAPLYRYSTYLRDADCEAVAGKFIPGVDCPVWRTAVPWQLDFPSILHRFDDPLFEERNMIDDRTDIADKMRKRLTERITQDGCPPEQLARLRL